MDVVKQYAWLLDAIHEGAYCVDRDRRIIYWNPSAERLTGYTRDEVVGHLCADRILQHVNDQGVGLCSGDCPLALTMLDGQQHVTDVFLHHKDGYRLPVSVRGTPLRDVAGRIVGALELFTDESLLEILRRRVDELESLVFVDTLTGLTNRRYLEHALRHKLDEWHRYGWPFAVMMLDIDHFKAVNDQYGHLIGDQVLRMVAQTLGHNSRSSDIFGRWGGEEFMGIIRNSYPDQLPILAERLRYLIATSYLTLESGVSLSVEISIGATMVRVNDTAESLYERADQLLYASKSAGRNRVTFDASDAPDLATRA